jgi:hypothetical protein
VNERCIATEFERRALTGGELHSGIRFERANKGPNSVATGGALMRELFIGTAPGKEGGVRDAKGLFIVESECPQSLRTVPVLPRDPRYPDKISDAAENHLADACRCGLRFDLTPAFSTRRRWVA